MGKSTAIRASEMSVRKRKARRRQEVERFLTRKRGPGPRGSEGEKRRGSHIGKRASGTHVDRERERRSATVTMSLGADGEGGIGRPRAGLQGEGRNRERESKREKE